jgi:uncharacterized membrane-anchored protein YhcB (DUF1043 family)
LVVADSCPGCGCRHWIPDRSPAPNAAPSRTQRQLDDIQERFDSYQNEVVTHFNSTAMLVKKLTQSYQEVQDHLAEGANRLALDEQTRQRLLAALHADAAQAPRERLTPPRESGAAA